MLEQIKKAFNSIKEYWAKLEPARKRLFAIIAGVVLALAIGLTIYLNVNGSDFVTLYQNMEPAESQQVYNALIEMGVEARMDNNLVQVPKAQSDWAKSQLAMQNIPKTTLSYDIFNSAGGLTTTDFEKRQILVQQLQDRLQDTIRQYDGIKNVFVTLSIAQESNRVWETTAPRSTGSVSVVLEDNMTLSRDQVSGIKYLVASSVGSSMDVSDVKVIDAATSISLKSREDEDPDSLGLSLDRLGFEERIESRLVEKATNILTLVYPQEDIRVSATVVLDYNKMLTESKNYSPLDGSNAGVLEHSEDAYVSDGSGIVGGIVGEENNTDTPVYVDRDGNGTVDYINNSRERDYAVSYIMQQIEKDQAELTSASIAVAINGDIDELTRASIIESISRATNISEARISVQNFIVNEPDAPVVAEPEQNNRLFIIILAGVLAALLLVIIIIIALSSRRRKKKKAQIEAERRAAARAAGLPDGVDVNSDDFLAQLEMRRRTIKEGAERTKQENAITDDVREFAAENPEITANILRSWLKEEDN